MNSERLLLRQVSPSFIQNGRPSSQTFTPFPKDDDLLSVDDGDMITAEQAYERFIQNPSCRSGGVLAVSRQECQDLDLEVLDDGVPYPEHCSIDFSAIESKKQKKMKAVSLLNKALARDWLFQPED